MRSACLCFVLLLSLTSPAMAALKIDRVYGWQDGIGLSSMPLVQKTKGVITVRLINSGEVEESEDVTLLGGDGKTAIGSTRITIPGKNSLIASIPWTPVSNGWKKITVVAGSQRASASVPVTVRKMYFPWYNNAPDSDRKLKYANIVLSTGSDSHEYWKSRGAVPCSWKGARSSVSFQTPKEYASYLGEGVSESGAQGILIDEMGGYSECDIPGDIYYQGLDEFTKSRDDLFVGLWACGSLKAPFCNITRNIYRTKGINLLMLEGYLNFMEQELNGVDRYAYFDQRIGVARAQDVLSNAVMILGIKGHEDKYPLTGSDLEDQVIYVRTHAPEMPGIGFFCTGGTKPGIPLYADALCRKYFIDPVIAVWDRDVRVSNVTPKAGETIHISVDVYNIGGIDASNVQARFYDDERMIDACQLSIPAGGGIPSGRTTATVDWKVVPGWNEVTVQIIPPDGMSMVSGVASRRIFVRY